MELPFPPPPANSNSNNEEEEAAVPPADFGRMGWRLGKAPLRKIANDRFGRRGTTARVLLRTATLLDVLNERSSWPKPPPGFSTKHIPGPGSDIPQRKQKQQQPEKKRTREDNNEGDDDGPRNEKGEPSLLDRGLKATRAGFSTEELEAGRAKKRAITSNTL